MSTNHDDFKTANELLDETLPVTAKQTITPRVETPVLRRPWVPPTNEGRYRLLEKAVEEAQYYPRDICNQGCRTHIYKLPGEVREQRIPDPFDKRRGEIHDCLTKRMHFMFKGYWNEIQISLVRKALERIRSAPASEIHIAIEEMLQVLKVQERRNFPWGLVFDKWKKMGGSAKAIPKSKDVEKILDD